MNLRKIQISVIIKINVQLINNIYHEEIINIAGKVQQMKATILQLNKAPKVHKVDNNFLQKTQRFMDLERKPKGPLQP